MINYTHLLISENGRKSTETEGKDPGEALDSRTELQQKQLLRHILEMVADQSGFLIEEKLDELLKPYTEDEKTFVRLDNVFVASLSIM